MSDRERQPKVDCPHCGHWDTIVWKTPGQNAEGRYERIRKCCSCRRQFETEETAKIVTRSDVTLQPSSTSLH